MLGGKPRPRAAARQHAFMGLLTCARCGCAMTAEKKKGKFWTRKSQEWEDELRTVEGERARHQERRPLSTTTTEKILELAKQAEFLYQSQNPTEQRRLLETVLSNCTFDRGTLCPT